jgi:hypothetical protein
MNTDMNLWDAFAPHILYSAGIIASAIVIIGFEKHRLPVSLPAVLWVILALWIGYTLLFLLFIGFFPLKRWLRAKPTEDWERKVKEVHTVILLGFGYEDDCGDMKPGDANKRLLEWTMDHTEARTLLVQEGVWVAACESSEKECTKSGRKLMRIHRHDPTVYLNTLDTAFCAMQELEKLGEKEAVLVTHDLQLKRAAWDFGTVKQSRRSWQDIRFVIPEMPDMPYPKASIHWHTRSEWVWRIIELLVARPRDFLGPIPDECKAPMPTT